MNKRKITLKNAATILGVSEERIEKYVSKGKLSSTKKKKKIYVYEDEVQKLRNLGNKFKWFLPFAFIIITILFYLGFFTNLGSDLYKSAKEKWFPAQPIVVNGGGPKKLDNVLSSESA